MKNQSNKVLTFLLAAGILLPLLGCNRVSGPSGQNANTVTPVSNTNSLPGTSPANKNGAADAPVASALKVGIYQGKSKETTHNIDGDFVIRIDTVDKIGEIEGSFVATGGLIASAPLTGTYSNDGKIFLAGKIEDGEGIIITAILTNGTIKGEYSLADLKHGLRGGSFTVSIK